MRKAAKPEGDLARIGVAIPGNLLREFDRSITRKGYATRSEAFRDLIRDELIQETVALPEQEVVGTLTLVYDHHVRQLSDRLTQMQHEHHHQVVSTLHVHLDHRNCLEVLVLRGQAAQVRKIADRLIAAKGIHHGKLTLTTPRQE
jgi:CopG family transcriptional regulator, nickel-responsive regulator